MPSTCEARTGQTLEAQNACVKEREPGQKETPDRGAHLTTTPPRSTESHSEKPDAVPTKACTGTCTKASSLPGNPDSTTAPCKLLTLLEKDPTADITQVPLPTQTDKQPCKTSNPEDCSSDGVECATAYKMLMQYATSDEKMGRIAAALESGCTPSAAGGCKVKKSVVWSVLDEECT
ncbi:uncharacterized protein EI97DRAFT_432619 [Westerdykella ornata]|uniref:Uncharacterized protein n=1 Tax=Westerdykella ornata TaxID=318751 RepID=A0A6A6JK32_WESOR|nr:uncharacterized protein EI97DRAFT_432619 [Westerdykella ornata]KAF2277000.1 hypothetical protein EI97DRAFT_432619 [Westerdykella ornata]